MFTGIPFSSLFSAESGKQCRRRKARTVFSDQQLCGLERRFEAQRYLSTPERVELASALNLSETQVKIKIVFQIKSFPIKSGNAVKFIAKMLLRKTIHMCNLRHRIEEASALSLHVSDFF